MIHFKEKVVFVTDQDLKKFSITNKSSASCLKSNYKKLQNCLATNNVIILYLMRLRWADVGSRGRSCHGEVNKYWISHILIFKSSSSSLIRKIVILRRAVVILRRAVVILRRAAVILRRSVVYHWIQLKGFWYCKFPALIRPHLCGFFLEIAVARITPFEKKL